MSSSLQGLGKSIPSQQIPLYVIQIMVSHTCQSPPHPLIHMHTYARTCRVRGLKEGDAVSFVGGAYSEYVLARGMLCTKIPTASADYAALAISGTTAVSALEAVGGIKQGETVLVTAAAGGTGHFAVQLAKVRTGAYTVCEERDGGRKIVTCTHT